MYKFPASKIPEIIVEAISNVNSITSVEIITINTANSKGVKTQKSDLTFIPRTGKSNGT